MTIAHPPHKSVRPDLGASLHRFTVKEYLQMRDKGVFSGYNPIEMIEGLLLIKGDTVPPYGVPIGIPPVSIWSESGKWGSHPHRRFTTAEYGRLIDADTLNPANRHELLEGWVVDKMTHKPEHDFVLSCLQDALQSRLPPKWCLRIQMGITLDESTPEPDLTVVPLPRAAYSDRHPLPHEVQLLVEVAHATLAYDLGIKRRTYARNRVENLWVIDVVGKQLHLFTNPSGPVDEPEFSTRDILNNNDAAPFIIREKHIADIPVSEFFNY